MYGLPGEGARFCGLHKTAVMENVYHSRCAQPGCDGLSPSYGFDDGSVPEGGAADKRRFCQAHKQAGMKDMVSVTVTPAQYEFFWAGGVGRE